MSYQEDFYRFIEENRQAFDAVLPIKINTLEPEDLRILCNHVTYRAGEPHYREMGGKMDKSMIDAIRVFFNKPGVNRHAAVARAFSWYENGAMNPGSLKEAIFDQPVFSPRIEAYLQSRRQEKYRMAFSNMQRSIVKLGDEIRAAMDIMRTPEPLSSKPMALRIQAQMRKINAALERCDKCGRAGMAWAHRAGIPIDKSSRSIHSMYLSKLPQLERAVSRVESVLKTQGIQSTVGNQINKRQFIWRHDIQMIRDELKQQARGRHQQKELSYAMGL